MQHQEGIKLTQRVHVLLHDILWPYSHFHIVGLKYLTEKTWTLWVMAIEASIVNSMTSSSVTSKASCNKKMSQRRTATKGNSVQVLSVTPTSPMDGKCEEKAVATS